MKKEKKELVDKMIDSILNDFDFEKVRKVMLAIGMGTLNDDGTISVPSIYQLIKQAKWCLRACAEHYGEEKEWSAATGGFEARQFESTLTLKFSIWQEEAFEEDFVGEV